MNIMFVQKKLLFQIISLATLLLRIKSKLELQIQPKKITYDPSKIDEIIQKLGIPKNYNFIEEENLNILDYVKYQGDCGSCWAMAETTALSYRYYKQTKKETNLSVQYPLSCFSGDCDDGAADKTNVDNFLDLAKNGTVTENCFSYNSSDGTVENCPLICRDGSQFTKYYAKNIYKLPQISQENYYDNVEKILFQLYNYGPIYAGILKGLDFELFGFKSNCGDHIFVHNESYVKNGGHSVVIVGYGYSDVESKYYWIVQNSYGKDFCDNGIIKIEFGQVNIEDDINFFEAKTENEPETKKNINVKFLSINEQDCSINIEISDNDLINMEDSFEITFHNSLTSKDFIYQCGSITLPKTKKLACYYEARKFEILEKGSYQFYGINSLGNKNDFFDFNFYKQSIFFSGYADKIMNFRDNRYYISGEGSTIILRFRPQFENENQILPEIYANSSINTPLSDCHYLKYNNDYLIYCNIKSNELEYFNYYEEGIGEIPMVYTKFCGYKETTNLNAYRLDEDFSPIFYINKLILPNQEEFSGTNIALRGYFKGNIIDKTSRESDTFSLLIKIKKKSEKEYSLYKLLCQFLFSKVIISSNLFEMKCGISSDIPLKKKECKGYQILPYFMPDKFTQPYEIIVLKDIEVVDNNKSSFLKGMLSKRLLAFIYICLIMF